MQSNTEVDVNILSDETDHSQGDGGVPHGAALIAFVDAAMTVDPDATGPARERLRNGLGDAGVVDAAAVAAMFQLNTRAADSAGIPVEDRTVESRDAMGARLGFAPRVGGAAP